MFYIPSRFPFVERLERDWRIIRDEFVGLEPHFAPWYGEKKWSVYAFYDGLDNKSVKKNEENASRCPRTMEIIDSIPGVTTAGVSRLEPGKYIHPHRDDQCFLRCHLGLVVPAGCAIRIAGVTKQWEEGRCLVMSAHSIHEAWNRSDRDRTILVVDVRPETLGFSLKHCLEPVSFKSRINQSIQFAHYVARSAAVGTTGAVRQ